MRHYEIVFLVHPDHTGQVAEMTERYKTLIEAEKGKMHRLENWGIRALAYPIRKTNRAHYVLMNMECSPEALKEIKDSFHFNDAVIRHLIVRREQAITEPSVVVAAESEENKRDKVA